MNQRKIFAAVIFIFFAVSYFVFKNTGGEKKIKPNILIAKNEAYELYLKEDLLRLAESLAERGFREEADFKKIPFVERAVFSKAMAGPDQITVYLQQPVLAFSRRGKYKLVDKNGEVFSEVPQYKIPNLPIISGSKFDAKKNRFKAVNVYLKLQKKGVLSKESLSEILINEDLVFVFSGVKGRVLIGEKSVTNRVERLSKVITYLRFHGLEAEILDARFSDRVVVSLSKKSPKRKKS